VIIKNLYEIRETLQDHQTFGDRTVTQNLLENWRRNCMKRNNPEFDLDQKYVCSITPTEFEGYCQKILLAYAEEEGLPDFSISHNVKKKTHDGKYQIDLFATFTAMGVEIKVVCECKQYKNRVNREKVVVLADKVKSLGAHKGILLSTSGFQTGAIEYAKEHGIALIQVYDHGCEHYYHSGGKIADEDDPFLYGERHMPPYLAINWTTDTKAPERIFPTKAMIGELLLEQTKLINERYGLSLRIDEISEVIER